MKDSLNVLPLLLVGTGVILFSFSDVVFKILTSLDILWWDFLVFGVPFEILLILIITLLVFLSIAFSLIPFPTHFKFIFKYLAVKFTKSLMEYCFPVAITKSSGFLYCNIFHIAST